MHLWCGPPAGAGGRAPATKSRKLRRARQDRSSSSGRTGPCGLQGASGPLFPAWPLPGPTKRPSSALSARDRPARPPAGFRPRRRAKNLSVSVPVRATGADVRITAAAPALRPVRREQPGPALPVRSQTVPSTPSQGTGNVIRRYGRIGPGSQEPPGQIRVRRDPRAHDRAGRAGVVRRQGRVRHPWNRRPKHGGRSARRRRDEES